MTNNKLNIIKGVLLSLAVSLGLSGCNFLDFDEATGKSQEEAFAYFSEVKMMTSAIYRNLPIDFGTIDGAMRESATDNSVYTWNNNKVYDMYSDAWGPLNLIDDQWGRLYDVIYDANFFLENYSEENMKRYEWSKNYEDDIKRTRMYLNEIVVLRALYHFELAKRYGDIPLVRCTYSLEDINKLEKKPFNEIIDFVVQQCDSVKDALPETYVDFFQETGRVTKGAAMAIKARALLYAASPLFNPENDPAKWERAAVAANDIMSLQYYSLPSKKDDPLYSVDGGNNVLQSPQLIFETRGTENNTFEGYNMPIGYEGGNSGNTPTQNLVDDFQVLNSDGTAEDFDWNNTQHVSNMYYDRDGNPTRDPRLYMTVVCNGMNFMGNTVETFVGGKNAQPMQGATMTGYYLKKLMNETVSLSPVTPVKKFHHFPNYRYAEVLLNYAEAMNRIGGADYFTGNLRLSARMAVNEVRTAAGMPEFTGTYTPDEFEKIIKRERRIELAFEDHRFWDIRRWKEGDLVKEIYGVKITKSGNNSYEYSKELVQTRVWENKMYLYPIPQNETYVNPNLKQNPEWE